MNESSVSVSSICPLQKCTHISKSLSLATVLGVYLDPCRVFLSLLRCLCLFILVLRFLRTLSAYIAPAGASANELHAVACFG